MRKIISLIVIFSVLFSLCCLNSNKEKQINISQSFEELERLPFEYPPELAQKNNDILEVHGKCSDIERFEKFVNLKKNKKGEKIRITRYSIEGDPIIFDLIKSGKGFILIEDNIRDKFGSDRSIKEFKVSEIEENHTENGKQYIAKFSKHHGRCLLNVLEE